MSGKACKRAVSGDLDPISSKRVAPSSKSTKVLPEFWSWCERNGMKISPKVTISDECIHRYGMVATDAIKTTETLFEIPRSLFLWEDNHSLGELEGVASLDSKSGWIKLLLVLSLEYTNGNSSKWAPYIEFSPDPDTLDSPIFWPPEIRKKLLEGTNLYNLVENDIGNIEKEYNEIALPYIESHEHLGYDKSKHTLELFMRMAGFIMAYSFTDPDDGTDNIRPPKMVPMADVLNHVSRHNAHLQYDENSWKMVATRDILPQEEIFNTFGYLSNAQLLQMYGFVENDSKSDSVEIPVNLFKKSTTITLINEKWKYLFDDDSGILAGCDSITVGRKGILSSDELKAILKVLTLTPSEFESYEGDEWESDSESNDSIGSDDSVYVISFSRIKQYTDIEKSLLLSIAKILQNELSELLEEKKKITFSDDQNNARKSKVIILLENQISILNLLVESCL